MVTRHLAMVIIRMLWLAGLLVAQSSEDDKTDDDDLLSLLQDHQNSEVPREKYKELGFGDGYFNGKKIKRIVKVSDEGNNEGGTMVKGGEGSLEKVEDIEDVERFHKIKSLKPIKKMTQIDADLADKMRKEVRGEVSAETEDTHYPPQSQTDDPDLAAKVSRVLKMFNASDLDDIIKVVPISSMRKIKSKTRVHSRGDDILGVDPPNFVPDTGLELDSAREDNFPIDMQIINEDRYGLSDHEPSGLNLKRYGADKIETENEALKGLDDEIERISQTLVDNARLLDKERELQEVLGKMMNVQREKLMKIKEVMDDHRAKEMELSRKEVEINDMLKKAQQQKIHHLKELQNLAERHINEIDSGGSYNGGRYKGGSYTGGSYNSGTYNDGSYNGGSYNGGKSYHSGRKAMHEGTGNSDLYLDPEYKYISKRGYDVMPVKKIKSIKKLKSVLKLTDEQASRLAQWQQARSVDPGYMPA